jgi:protein-L-isoaspartate(D-aspartate) O-methyltransferase
MAPLSYAQDPDLARQQMVKLQLEARGVADPAVLGAMAAVPRHRFLEPEQAKAAYEDHPVPIGRGQTISQPFIVAFMAEALGLRGTEKVLEVGSGCGYMAAVLSRLCRAVYGIELEPDLLRRAQATLAELGVPNATLRCGDGRLGWRSKAPFDAILLSCAADVIPPDLWEQLAEGGRILLPLAVHPTHQDLVLVWKTAAGAVTQSLLPVVFVPLR